MPTVFSLSRTALNQIDLEPIGEVTSDALTDGVTSATVYQKDSKITLAIYRRGDGELRLLSASSFAPILVDKASLAIGDSYDQVCTFHIGNRAHAMCYRKKSGQVAFFEIEGGILSTYPYRYARLHEPATTTNLSMLDTFVNRGLVSFMGYSYETGQVALYTLNVTATSTGGAPPLICHHVWAGTWSPGWVRFFFFEMGGANFFLKTNVARLNVNIDRIYDDLSQGTAEVASHLEAHLPGAVDIVSLRGFYMEGGEPFFAAVGADGTLSVYRIHPDCRGWTQVATRKGFTTQIQLLPFTINGRTLLLVF